jgi:hypothetical protein
MRSTSVVVHYGDPAPTVRLVNAVAAFDTDVVVVANDCSPRPPAITSAAEWIIPERNLGYGAAFSEAIRDRTSEAFVVLNTDIVLTKKTFDHCLDTLLKRWDAGIVAPVLRHEDGTLQSGAARLSRWRRAPKVLVDPGQATVECLWVTGAVMFIRREVAHGIGMDGSFFLGGEDADLCLRARGAGWRILCCGDSAATHHGGRVISGPRWSYYSTRNRVWFVRANFGHAPALLNWIHSIALLPRVAVADMVKRRGLMSSRLTLMGIAHALWRKPRAEDGPLPGEPFPARIMKW